jgi:hypothetical protein
MYFDVCQKENLTNNSDVKSMGFNTRPEEAWWVVKYNSEIISVSGCHKFTFLGPNAWRVLFRSATIKKYRGRAGPISKAFTNDFNWGHILKHQIEYCQQLGGKDFYITTNQNSISHKKTDRMFDKTLRPQGYVMLIDEKVKIYDVEQNIWKIEKFPF